MPFADLARAAACAALALTAQVSHAQNYAFTGPTYTTLTNFTICGVPPCNTFTTAMRVQGTFTTAVPLAANLTNQNILASITSFSFTNGRHTFASTDPLVTLMNAAVTTDAAGNPVSMTFVPIRWRGPAPHAVGDRLDALFVDPSNTTAFDNSTCATLSAPDGCSGLASDTSTSRATENTVPRAAPVVVAAPVVAASSVPMLGPWSLGALIALMGLAGARVNRKKAA